MALVHYWWRLLRTTSALKINKLEDSSVGNCKKLAFMTLQCCAFGYGGLVERLAYPLLAEKRIRLGHEVISIATTSATTRSTGNNGSNTNVVVRCKIASNQQHQEEEIQEFHASACTVALPLGVLQAAVKHDDSSSSNSPSPPPSPPPLVFEPQLPSSIVNSIQALGIAVHNKIELLFPFRWWPEHVERFHLACTHLQQSPTYHPYTTFIVESASSSSSTAAKNDMNNDNDSDNATTTADEPNILVLRSG